MQQTYGQPTSTTVEEKPGPLFMCTIIVHNILLCIYYFITTLYAVIHNHFRLKKSTTVEEKPGPRPAGLTIIIIIIILIIIMIIIIMIILIIIIGMINT